MSWRRPEAVSFQVLQDCGLGNQQPVPKRNRPDPAFSNKPVNCAMSHAELCGDLPTGIVLLDHSPILQARRAKKAAGPRAHSASQVQVIQSTASGVFICPPPRKTAESRKFQKNAPAQPPGSTPSHSRQTDPSTDPSPGTKKGGSYLALLSFGFCHGLHQQLPHDCGPAHHLAFSQLGDDFINFCGDFGLNYFCHNKWGEILTSHYFLSCSN